MLSTCNTNQLRGLLNWCHRMAECWRSSACACQIVPNISLQSADSLRIVEKNSQKMSWKTSTKTSQWFDPLLCNIWNRPSLRGRTIIRLTLFSSWSCVTFWLEYCLISTRLWLDYCAFCRSWLFMRRTTQISPREKTILSKPPRYEKLLWRGPQRLADDGKVKGQLVILQPPLGGP